MTTKDQKYKKNQNRKDIEFDLKNGIFVPAANVKKTHIYNAIKEYVLKQTPTRFYINNRKKKEKQLLNPPELTISMRRNMQQSTFY